MKTINQVQLIELLKGVKGTTFASILYFVDESKSVTDKGEKIVKKLTFTPVTLGSNYSNKVYNVMTKKQGADENFEFEAKKMSGRSLICPTIVQSDRSGVLGIYGIVENHVSKKAKRTKFFYDGKFYSRKELEKLDAKLKKKGEKGILTKGYFTAPSTAGQGQIKEENNFGIITTHLTNIRKIKLNGEVYRVK